MHVWETNVKITVKLRVSHFLVTNALLSTEA